MKHFALILIALATGITVEALTLTQVRTRVDTALTNLWQQLSTRQDTYYAAHGRYWQCLISTTNTPNWNSTNSADSLPNNTNAIPFYQVEQIVDVFPELLTNLFPAAIMIDQYRGPLGDGYVGTVIVQYQGTNYYRVQQRGPETWRTSAWSVLATNTP